MERIDDSVKDHMFFRHSDGEIEIGIHPVIFGNRIRAGFVGSWAYELDYCAGAIQEDIEEVYSMVLHILKNQDVRDFRVFPSFKRKPILNDPDCINKLREMSVGMKKINIPPIQIYRSISLRKIFEDA